MPGVAPNSGAGIFQRLELEPMLRQTDGASICEQQLAIRRDEVRHLSPLPQMSMEPEAAIHGVHHPIAELCEFFKCRRDVGHVAVRLVAGDNSRNGCRRNRRGGPHEQRTEMRIRKRVL